jgi:hypothetical protein
MTFSEHLPAPRPAPGPPSCYFAPFSTESFHDPACAVSLINAISACHSSNVWMLWVRLRFLLPRLSPVSSIVSSCQCPVEWARLCGLALLLLLHIARSALFHVHMHACLYVCPLVRCVLCPQSSFFLDCYFRAVIRALYLFARSRSASA